MEPQEASKTTAARVKRLTICPFFVAQLYIERTLIRVRKKSEELARHASRILHLVSLFAKAENEKLLQHFGQAGVDFLVVGGAAVAFHGCREYGQFDDLDLLIAPTIENCRRVVDALSFAGVPLTASAESLAKPAIQVSVKNWQYWAEILTPRKGVDYDSIAQSALPGIVGLQPVRVISRAELIKMKEDAIAKLRDDLNKHEKDLACLKASPDGRPY